MRLPRISCLLIFICFASLSCFVQAQNASLKDAKNKDAKNSVTGNAEPVLDPDLKQYGIYAASAPRA